MQVQNPYGLELRSANPSHTNYDAQPAPRSEQVTEVDYYDHGGVVWLLPGDLAAHSSWDRSPGAGAIVKAPSGSPERVAWDALSPTAQSEYVEGFLDIYNRALNGDPSLEAFILDA